MSKTVALLQHEKKSLQSTLDGLDQKIVEAQHQEELDAAEKQVATVKLRRLFAQLAKPETQSADILVSFVNIFQKVHSPTYLEELLAKEIQAHTAF